MSDVKFQSQFSAYVVDDHPLVRAHISQLLEARGGCRVCGCSDTATKALSDIEALKPDLLVLDLSLAATHGLDLLKSLKLAHPKLAILVFSALDESIYAERVIEAGALGFVPKTADQATFLVAVDRVLHGDIYLSEKMTARTLRKSLTGKQIHSKSAIDKLSDRELEVFELIGKGVETKQIAEQLQLDVKTVETYRARIKEKLKLLNATALMRAAFLWSQESQMPNSEKPAPPSPK